MQDIVIRHPIVMFSFVPSLLQSNNIIILIIIITLYFRPQPIDRYKYKYSIVKKCKSRLCAIA